MYSIGVLAEKVGVSAETLRKWEQRYGLPAPSRTAGGTRRYSDHDLSMLHEVTRLIDKGIRPAEVFSKIRLSQNQAENYQQTQHDGVHDRIEIARLVNAVAENRLDTVRQALEIAIYDRGICNFIHTLAQPLMNEVGLAWERGELYVYAEHGISAVMHEVLAKVNADMAGKKQGIRILLVTPPGEYHTLGLSMIEAVIRSAGADCIQMGGDLPLNELQRAAVAFDVEVVGVSFSAYTPANVAEKYLLELQQVISDREIWIGGMGTEMLQAIPQSMHIFKDVYDVYRRVKHMAVSSYQS